MCQVVVLIHTLPFFDGVPSATPSAHRYAKTVFDAKFKALVRTKYKLGPQDPVRVEDGDPGLSISDEREGDPHLDVETIESLADKAKMETREQLNRVEWMVPKMPYGKESAYAEYRASPNELGEIYMTLGPILPSYAELLVERGWKKMNHDFVVRTATKAEWKEEEEWLDVAGFLYDGDLARGQNPKTSLDWHKVL